LLDTAAVMLAISRPDAYLKVCFEKKVIFLNCIKIFGCFWALMDEIEKAPVNPR
jgi:hypothetical protein